MMSQWLQLEGEVRDRATAANFKWTSAVAARLMSAMPGARTDLLAGRSRDELRYCHHLGMYHTGTIHHVAGQVCSTKQVSGTYRLSKGCSPYPDNPT